MDDCYLSKSEVKNFLLFLKKIPSKSEKSSQRISEGINSPGTLITEYQSSDTFPSGVIQGYNYGQGYITWALNKYGEYSKANAVEFSMKTAEQVGWNSYGDMDYVPHVLRYYPLGQLFYDPDGSSSIVEVAYSQIGNVGGDPYWSWYGFSNHVEWCACFVSWCADQCGYLDAGIIPKFSGCVLGINWFKERGQWQSNTYEPAPGDLIFFDWNKAGVGQDGISDHVGIVQKVENGRVYTIEGNSSDMCRERSYTIGNYQIMGYGVPAY